ncbi:MAG: universal stress protein [Actinomycetota bacterium]
MTGRVVVGYDGSEDAVRAQRWAAAHARAIGVGLEIVHAYDYPYLDRLGVDLRRELRDEALAVVHDGLRLVTDAEPAVTATVVVEVGEPGAVLVGRCTDADHLVVGRRGVRGAHPGTLGSVAPRCLHRAPGSVTVIR